MTACPPPFLPEPCANSHQSLRRSRCRSVEPISPELINPRCFIEGNHLSVERRRVQASSRLRAVESPGPVHGLGRHLPPSAFIELHGWLSRAGRLGARSKMIDPEMEIC